MENYKSFLTLFMYIILAAPVLLIIYALTTRLLLPVAIDLLHIKQPGIAVKIVLSVVLFLALLFFYCAFPPSPVGT